MSENKLHDSFFQISADSTSRDRTKLFEQFESISEKRDYAASLVGIEDTESPTWKKEIAI